MTHEILIGIVGVIVLGISAQWIAWRFRLPSILLLLLFGFLAGPVTGFIPNGALEGDWLYAFVSVSIGIILFEGGLSLRVSDLREVGTAVLNLVTIGVVVTWALAALAAYFIVGFEPGLAILTGAILTVTGPTVVVPLLRHVRPAGRVGTIAKWEGITVDPVGAILAVLVLEGLLLLHRPVTSAGGTFGSAIAQAVEGLLLTIVISVGISVIGAALLVFLLHRRLVPDYLQSSMALGIVVATFGLSNSLQEESGLLEATLMGIMLANQKWVPVRRITEFKEDLQVLLIGSLFILLSARLDIASLEYMLEPRALIILGVLILIVRPIAVGVSTLGSRLGWRERMFLAWLAPRGIVAAAVSALFAFRLRDIFPQAGELVPLVFLVIVGTVAVYGLTCAPVAHWLGLAHPNPQGVLILGASRWVRRMALVLKELGFRVILLDSNADNVKRAGDAGLEAVSADALSEYTLDALDLGGIGRFMALTPNDEVNSLACLNFSEIFDSSEVYQLAARAVTRRDRSSELPQHLRGHPLFGPDTTFPTLAERFERGGQIRPIVVGEDTLYNSLKEKYHDEMILLFLARGDELFVNSKEELTPQPGDTIVVFLPASAQPGIEDNDEYDSLVANSLWIDLERTVPFEQLAKKASALFAQRLPVTAETLVSGFLTGARYGAMPVADGVALPHYRLPNIEKPELLIVRCAGGLRFEMDGEADQFTVDLSAPVHAILFLVSPEDHPGQHLKILAHLANRIDSDTFLERWLAAGSEYGVKETLLDPERHLTMTVDGDADATFDGLAANELSLPGDAHVLMIEREGTTFVPTADTMIEHGDQLSIMGESNSIRRALEEMNL